jgi:hypothetical protein
MNTDDYIKKIEEENKELKEKLTKYTAPQRNKKYYENHKDVILAKNKEYQVTTEKKKEYANSTSVNYAVWIDINASKNILFLLQLQKAGKKRPECFLPSSKDDETPTIINCDTPSGR